MTYRYPPDHYPGRPLSLSRQAQEGLNGALAPVVEAAREAPTWRALSVVGRLACLGSSDWRPLRLRIAHQANDPTRLESDFRVVGASLVTPDQPATLDMRYDRGTGGYFWHRSGDPGQATRGDHDQAPLPQPGPNGMSTRQVLDWLHNHYETPLLAPPSLAADLIAAAGGRGYYGEEHLRTDLARLYQTIADSRDATEQVDRTLLAEVEYLGKASVMDCAFDDGRHEATLAIEGLDESLLTYHVQPEPPAWAIYSGPSESIRPWHAEFALFVAVGALTKMIEQRR